MIADIFDCHIHVEQGLHEYDLKISSGNVIFNFIDSYNKYAPLYPQFTHSLIFDYKNNFDFVANKIAEKSIAAIKVHSRIQQITEEDYVTLIQHLKLAEVKCPVIYDAFYFGSELDFQPSLKGLVKLATELPHLNFIVAHCGGHKVLEYFFHLRELKNIFFDLSFSLQYLNDTSCRMDLIKLIRYTDKQKIFFGSDYPFANPTIQYNHLKTIFYEIKLGEMDQQKIVKDNFLQLINT